MENHVVFAVKSGLKQEFIGGMVIKSVAIETAVLGGNDESFL
jgi:hypothetical protein